MPTLADNTPSSFGHTHQRQASMTLANKVTHENLGRQNKQRESLFVVENMCSCDGRH